MKKKVFAIGVVVVFGICMTIAWQTYIHTNTRKKFATSSIAPYAYQIAPGKLSHEAQSALVNFDFQEKLLANNVLEVKLKPQGNYYWKTFLLQKGYTLYFAPLPDAEGEINDMTNLDYIRYDVPILVDTNGDIISQQ